jgi:hypothetical protein
MNRNQKITASKLQALVGRKLTGGKWSEQPFFSDQTDKCRAASCEGGSSILAKNMGIK